MADSIQDIMQQDDDIDALTEFAVKDLVIRYDLMGSMQGNAPWGVVEEVEDVLINYDAEELRAWVLQSGHFVDEVEEIAEDNSSEEYVHELYDWLTKDDATVEMARTYLKKQLRGCIGMPRSSVIRKGIKRHND